jgi:hypothetical protein
MADASKLRRLSKSGLGPPPPVSEAREDLSGGSQAPSPTSSRPAASSRIDGRTLRRSGRTVQFATRVSPEFDERIREIARRERLLIVEVLERALDALEKRGI